MAVKAPARRHTSCQLCDLGKPTDEIGFHAAYHQGECRRCGAELYMNKRVGDGRHEVCGNCSGHVNHGACPDNG